MIRGTYGVYKGEVHFIEKCGEGKFYLYPNSESEIDGAVAAPTKKKTPDTPKMI